MLHFCYGRGKDWPGSFASHILSRPEFAVLHRPSNRKRPPARVFNTLQDWPGTKTSSQYPQHPQLVLLLFNTCHVVQKPSNLPLGRTWFLGCLQEEKGLNKKNGVSLADHPRAECFISIHVLPRSAPGHQTRDQSQWLEAKEAGRKSRA